MAVLWVTFSAGLLRVWVNDSGMSSYFGLWSGLVSLLLLFFVSAILGFIFKGGDYHIGTIQRFLMISAIIIFLLDSLTNLSEAVRVIILIIGLLLMIITALLGLKILVAMGALVFVIPLLMLVFSSVDNLGVPFVLLIIGIMGVLIGLAIAKYGFLKSYIYNQLDAQKLGLINDEKLARNIEENRAKNQVATTQNENHKGISTATKVIIILLIILVLPLLYELYYYVKYIKYNLNRDDRVTQKYPDFYYQDPTYYQDSIPNSINNIGECTGKSSEKLTISNSHMKITYNCPSGWYSLTDNQNRSVLQLTQAQRSN